jgi:hypothetical protein
MSVGLGTHKHVVFMTGFVEFDIFILAPVLTHCLPPFSSVASRPDGQTAATNWTAGLKR